ncbi:MAG: hypothetical protein U1E65_27875 [Myxococcota bacterium]
MRWHLLLLSALSAACQAPPPGQIDARFLGHSYRTLILGVLDSEGTRWYGIDGDSGQGSEAIPAFRVGGGEVVKLFAHLYEQPSASILARTGLLSADRVGDRVTLGSGNEVFELDLTVSATSTWSAISGDRAPAPSSSDLKLPTACPEITASAPFSLEGTEEPVSTTLRLPNGHALIFTGRMVPGDPAIPYRLGAYDFAPDTEQLVEIHPASLEPFRAPEVRVTAGVSVGDALILGIMRGVGGACELWRGRLDTGFTKWMDLRAGAPLLDVMPIPPQDPTEILIEISTGGTYRLDLATGAASPVLPERYEGDCFRELNPTHPSHSRRLHCAGIERGKLAGTAWVMQPPGDQLFLVDLVTNTAATIPLPRGQSYLTPVETEEGTFTMNSVQTQVISTLYAVGPSGLQMVQDLNTQQPTTLLAAGKFVLLSGLFGFVTAWSKETQACPSHEGALAGLTPSHALELGKNDWLYSGFSPEGRSFVVRVKVGAP